MLKSLGFDPIWISRGMACATTVDYCVLMNGDTVGLIHPSCGLQQGDPLSSYLFLICVEGLSALLQKNEVAGNIHGCKVARRAPSMNHRLFADDAYLLFLATPLEGTMVKNILDIHEAASGQTINYRKSSVTFSTNVDAQTKVTVCIIFQIQAEQNHRKYLGLPTLIGRNKKEVMFTYVKESLWHRLQGWRTKNLSRAGKEVLLKKVAEALSNYVMNIFLLPHEL